MSRLPSSTGITLGRKAAQTPLNTQQIVGFWAAWFGWMLDGMDFVIYAAGKNDIRRTEDHSRRKAFSHACDQRTGT